MQKYTITKYLIWTRRKLLVIGTLVLMGSMAFAPAAQAATTEIGLKWLLRPDTTK